MSAYIALHNCREAELFGGRLLQLAESYRRPLDELETLTLLAVNARRGKEDEAALDYARRAVRVAAKYGYVRILKDYWPVLAPVYKALLTAEKPPDKKSRGFLLRLIAACDALDRPSLTSQQLVILLDLRDGYSYEDISKHIGIMKNSAKTQINRMYKALGVKSAKDAVEKAEAFGLLDL